MATTTVTASMGREGFAPRLNSLSALATLARRRLQLTVRTPRELVVPLVTPLLFALVIAPALQAALHTNISYEAYVAVGTVGLLIPLNMIFAGISVLADRESGAQRELLAAPIPRSLMVIGNMSVAFGITALQIVTLIVAARLRGIEFQTSATGMVWFVAASSLFAVGMYGIAETLASRVARQEEYIAQVPAIAIVPWFLAGSLFPISALPIGLTYITKVLPLTHALAIMRYGLLDDSSGLRNIWGMTNTMMMAGLSLAVVTIFAAALTALSIRAYTRTAVH